MVAYAALIAALATAASCHSWIEQMQLIDDSGSYAGDPGYPRGYVARTDPGFNGYTDKWQLPSPDYDLGRTRINSTDYLCHPSQRTSNYTSQYPKLQVNPASYVALRYLENGHVTQPWIPAGKPAGSGTVFVYGTYSPASDERIADVLQWNEAGNGGNGNGFLITAQNFDDGRCHQPNQSPISIQRQMEFPDNVPGQESWCETDIQIPANSKTGSTLTLYWIWSWQTQTETQGATCGKDEYYTTCADVDVVDTSKNLDGASKIHTIVQQDPRSAAPSDYKSRTAIMTSPNLVTTEGCSVTSVTSSAWPASLTQPTTLPAGFIATYSNGDQGAAHTHAPATAPMPSGPPAGQPSSHQAGPQSQPFSGPVPHSTSPAFDNGPSPVFSSIITAHSSRPVVHPSSDSFPTTPISSVVGGESGQSTLPPAPFSGPAQSALPPTPLDGEQTVASTSAFPAITASFLSDSPSAVAPLAMAPAQPASPASEVTTTVTQMSISTVYVTLASSTPAASSDATTSSAIAGARLLRDVRRFMA